MKISSTALGLLALGASAFANPEPWNVVGADANPNPAPTSSSSSSSVSSSASLASVTTAPTRTPASDNPCAILSSSAKAYRSANPRATSVPFKPSQVLSCYRDVPIDIRIAATQIDWIKGIVQFQSTLTYLKTPPPGYDLPPVDIFGGLDAIRKKVLDKGFSNQFDFEAEVAKLIASAGDGHFNYIPVLPSLFSLKRNPLVSVSTDGLKLPKVYFKDEIIRNATNKNATAASGPSAIVRINGEDVTAFLLKIQRYTGLQGLDSRYNAALYNPATYESTQNGSFYSDKPYYFEDSIQITLENGQSRNITQLMYRGGPIDFASGQELYNKYVRPQSQSSKTASQFATSLRPSATSTTKASTTPTAVSTPTTSPASKLYPSPIIRHSANSIAGYFLNGTGEKDLAILNIVNFVEGDDDSISEFQSVLSKFLVLCKNANKTRLIVDVRGNPGGTAFLGFDAFKQILPTTAFYSNARFRATDASKAIAFQTSKIQSYDSRNKSTDLYALLFNYRRFTQLNGSLWPSDAAFFGPQTVQGDNFTNAASLRFNPPDDLATIDIVVSGTGNRTNLPAQVFKTENILILTDGHCASTCSAFGNLMVDEGKVRTITVGGRPSTEPIPAIAGVQGNNVLSWSIIVYAARSALNISRATDKPADFAQVNKTLGPLVIDPPFIPYNVLETGGGHVNFLDSIRRDDKAQIPRQFLKKFADCRIFYLQKDIVDVTAIWSRVAGFWKNNGNGLCVARNGTGPSGLNGTATAVPPSSTAPPGSTPPPVAKTSTAGASATTLPLQATGAAVELRRVGAAGFAAVVGVVAALTLL